MRSFRPLRLLGVLALTALAPAVSAQTHTFNVCLSGDQEVPPVATAGSGTATVSLDATTGAISVTGSYQNLGSNQTLAHVHLGALGVNGGVVLSLSGTGGTTGTFSGSGTLSPSQTSSVTAGNTYLNVHSAALPGGELRGQVIQLGNATCDAEFPTDPVIADSAGDPDFGPKIGSAVDTFNVTIDCSNAVNPAIYAIELRPAKLAPTMTKWGCLYLAGPKLTGTVGAHNTDVRSFFPGAGAALPNDISLVGIRFHVQGFCGGYVPNGRASTVLSQTIGI